MDLMTWTLYGALTMMSCVGQQCTTPLGFPHNAHPLETFPTQEACETRQHRAQAFFHDVDTRLNDMAKHEGDAGQSYNIFTNTFVCLPHAVVEKSDGE